MTTRSTTKNFGPTDRMLECSCGCGTFGVRQWALDNLQLMRDDLGPLTINSGYRCANHPVEAKKTKPGQHNLGVAFDIKVVGSAQAYAVIASAIKHGCKGFAYSTGFVHVDWRAGTPVTWIY